MTAPWIFAAGVVSLLLLVSYTMVRSGLLLRYWTPRNNLLLSLPDNAVRLGMLAFCVLLGVTAGPGPQALGWSISPSLLGRDLLMGIVVGLIWAVGLNLVGMLVVRRWGEEVFSTKVIRCMLPINGSEWAGVLAALLPAAALEEMLFRSLPLGGLAWLVPPWWILWPLSLFFGLLHWPQGSWGVAGATISAIMLSLLFLATGGIWAPLAAHYTINLTQLALARLSGLEPLRAAS